MNPQTYPHRPIQIMSRAVLALVEPCLEIGALEVRAMAAICLPLL